MARVEGCEAVYDIANQWKERCLQQDKSLLWPDLGEDTWTEANIDSLLEAFLDHLDQGEGSFTDKWQVQLANKGAAVHRIAVDVVAVYELFPRARVFGQRAKIDLLSTVSSWKAGPIPTNSLLFDALSGGLAKPGAAFNTMRPWVIAYFLQFARTAKKSHADLEDPESWKRLGSIASEGLRATELSRNILLHLLNPDFFEAMASQNYKLQIVNNMRQDLLHGVDLPDDVDDALKIVRSKVEAYTGKTGFQFWDDDIAAFWDNKKNDQEVVQIAIKGTIESVAERAYCTHEDVALVYRLLCIKKQLIFEGPPGCGKTFLADLFARYLTGNPLEGDRNEQIEFVQFHQSYGYEDFVEGIRPVSDEDGRLQYRVVPGIFLRMCARAEANPDKKFVLVIDEINRGNLSRIFGELMMALEYRDKQVKLPYSSGDDSTPTNFLTIPKNLYLIGTMNSTDRSLAMIDYALRRRFYFYPLRSVVNGDAPVLRRWLEAQEIDSATQQRLISWFLRINEVVTDRLSDDFQVGHSYLMNKDVEDAKVEEEIWHFALLPLLHEYFHGDKESLALVENIPVGGRTDHPIPSADFDNQGFNGSAAISADEA